MFYLQLGTLVPIATPAPPTTIAPPVRVDIQSSNLLNNLPPLLNTPTVSEVKKKKKSSSMMRNIITLLSFYRIFFVFFFLLGFYLILLNLINMKECWFSVKKVKCNKNTLRKKKHFFLEK